MAGSAQRSSRGRGRTPRRASSPALLAAVSTVEHGSADIPLTPPPAMPADPPLTDQPVTRSTYRSLLMKGLTPDEAADLTAFMCGIPVVDVHWSLRQVNQLLFFRELARSGRFGSTDGESPRRH